MSTTQSWSSDPNLAPPGPVPGRWGFCEDYLPVLWEELRAVIVSGLGKAYEFHLQTSKLLQHEKWLQNRGASGPHCSWPVPARPWVGGAQGVVRRKPQPGT